MCPRIFFALLIDFSEYKLDYVPITGECNRCDLKQSITNESSKRDIIVTTAFNKINNLVPFIHTLRAFNKECRVLVFTNEKAFRIAQTFLDYAQCGIEFLIFPYEFQSKIDIWFYRWVLIGNYLIQHQKEIDNVIHIDLFDSIFQSDPFARFKDNKTFYFCYEDANYYKEFKGNPWVKYEFDNVCDTLQDHECSKINYTELLMSLYSVNAGMQVGNIKDFIKFTQFMRKYGDEHTHKGREDDQHFLTFSMALKKFDEILNYQILNYSSDFMVAGSRYYMNHPKKIKGQKFGNWSVNGKVPVIYHQFDRTNYYITQIKRKCKLHGILADHTSIKS